MSADKGSIINDALVKEIREAVSKLEYGVVTIKVHASKIIQIDVTERRRYDDLWRIDEGGGI